MTESTNSSPMTHPPFFSATDRTDGSLVIEFLTKSVDPSVSDGPDDKKKGEPSLTTLKVDKKGKAKVILQPNGGLILK